MARKLWKYIRRNRNILQICSFLYNLFMLNSIHIKHGNKLNNAGGFLKKTKIKVRGKNNTIILEAGVRLNNCIINMSGNNAVLHIQEGSYAEQLKFHFEDNSCVILIGKNCIFSGGEFAVAEDGRKIIIGDECLFSKNIQIVTTDSHSIIDRDTGKRVNKGEDVIVGKHVWLTAGVTLLKGSAIPNECVVGRNAVVTRKFEKENCVIVGCPGKCIREKIEWQAERI